MGRFEGESQKIRMKMVYFSVLLFSCAYSVYGLIMPQMKEAYRITAAQSGWIGQAQYLGEFAALLFMGILIRRIDRNLLLNMLIALFALLLWGLGEVKSFHAVLLIFVGMGICSSTINLSASSLAADTYPQKRSRYLNWLHGIFGVGSVIGPLIPALFQGQEWYAAYRVLAAVLFAYALVYRMALGGIAARRQNEKQRIHIANISGIQKNREGRSAGYRVLLKDRYVCFLFFLLVLCNGQQCGYTMWIPTFMKENAEAASVVISGTSAFYNVGNAMGRLLYPIMQKQWKERNLLILGTLGGAVCLAAGILSGSGSGMFFLGGCTGFLTGMVMPTLLGKACDHYSQESGTVTALMCMACSLGAISIPWLCGRLMEKMGAITGMMLLPVCLLLIGSMTIGEKNDKTGIEGGSMP